MANIDWIAIENEYISSNTSYRKLAEKYNISRSAIEHKAKVERWAEAKKKHQSKTKAKVRQKTVDIAVKKEVNRIEKMLELGDTAGEQIKVALSQLNKYITASGNVAESELVDVDRLRKLVSAIKDIKDIVREDRSTDNSNILQKIVEGFMEI